MASPSVYPGEVVAEVHHRPLTLDAIYREHFKAVWRLLRRLGVTLAQLDDATQDVFLVVHRKLAGFDPRAPIRSWVFAIAVRVASDYRRRALRGRTEPFDDAIAHATADVTPSPARLCELQESVEQLHEILGELDDKKRTVFVLSELEQLSAPEIASVLGVNLNTVYSRLRSAKDSFEAALFRRKACSSRGARS
jgi:RNA polymerase sigma-70 factor (ECF subfamily)